MKVTENNNRKQQTLDLQGYNFEWYISYDTSQKLDLSVSAETADEVGLTVGLIQNVVESQRVATYEGGTTLSLIPQAGVPCLDATPKKGIKPYYNEFCKGQKLQAVGEAIKLEMEDSPGANVASQAVLTADRDKKDKKVHPITELSVTEKFVLNLWVTRDGEEVKDGVATKQWDWMYSYKIVPGESSRKLLLKGDSVETDLVERKKADIKQDITLGGTVATENGKKVWNPEGWEGVNWPS